MAAVRKALLRYLRRLVNPSAPDEAADAVLLGRFIARRDEEAFAALVVRHGPLVLGVCRRVLGNVHDAEDAFQAAFLVLARKANAVHPRAALAAWLHGVARRVALKARSARARPAHEILPPPANAADPHPDPLAELSGRELLTIIDDELQRLPEVYRTPVILCCLEGHSLEEAARQLGWTQGSVKGRLERGRARLHQRLVRRGLTFAAALAAAEVSRVAAPAAVVAQLVACTVRGAAAFGARQVAAAGGVSEGATALAREAVKTVVPARRKIATAILLATGLLTTGFLLSRAASSLAPTALAVKKSPAPSEDDIAPAAPAASVGKDVAAVDADDTPIEVSGRVLDTQGRPFVGAKLYVGYSVRRNVLDRLPRQLTYPLRATSDEGGRFHFTFTRSELDPELLDDSRPAVAAVADGFGPDWAEVRTAADGAGLSLRLVEDVPIKGRILDQNRRPVAGASVVVADVHSDAEDGVTQFLQGEGDSWFPKTWRGPLPGQPEDVTTDADGRFLLTGLGRDRVAELALDGPGIRHSTPSVVARTSIPDRPFGVAGGARFEYVAQPSRPIRGVVRDKATGKTVAGVRITTQSNIAPVLTDADGRYEIPGGPRLPQTYCVMAQPPAGRPYFAASATAQETPGADPITVDLDLAAAIPLTGRVKEQVTGKPPKTAIVEYYPLLPNPNRGKLTNCLAQAAASAPVGPDGSFSLAVLPGPGVVCVAASPRNSYAVAVADDDETAKFFPEGMNHGGAKGVITAGGPGGQANLLPLNKYHALSLINPDEKAESASVDLTLQRGRTLQGTVVGPDGGPLCSVEVLGLTATRDEELLEGGSFTVLGLNARGNRTLSFQHRGKELGKVLTVRGDETGPLTVRLDPCGWVVGRVVDGGGKPASGTFLTFQGGDGTVLDTQTDRDGRFRATLLPGMKYSMRVYGSRRRLKTPCDIDVESGRGVDLGAVPLAD
jgi:RNA polymerase sigma factor (sigma-70 family)